MRESIGSTFLYNMIIVYIILVIGLLTATLNYYKGYKVNTRILNSINKYSGYNELSYTEIENYLSSIGYVGSPDHNCSERKGLELVNVSKFSGSKYAYCVYYNEDETNSLEKEKIKKGDKYSKYYNYGVVSYIYVDLPLIDSFKVPVYTKGERIYKFNDGQFQLGV